MAALVAISSISLAEEDCVKSAQLVKKALDLGEGSAEEIELYKEAQTLCPKMAEAHFNLGLAYQKRGDLEGAERELREAVRLKEDEHFAIGLAGVLLQRGEVSAARDNYEKVLSSNSKSVPALQGIALILEKQRKLSDAADILEKAAEIEPANSVTSFNLGVLYEQLKRPDSALAAYKRAAEGDPKNF
jgi:tetratricopeptide (TPR) repeat protein